MGLASAMMAGTPVGGSGDVAKSRPLKHGWKGVNLSNRPGRGYAPRFP